MIFTLIPEESPSQRVARVAREAVKEGPMGCYLNRARYVDFLGIWENAQSLAHVKTSCAIFAGAVWGYCGKKLRKPWKADGSWGIVTWLGLKFDHESWLDAIVALRQAKDGTAPIAGDVMYRGLKTGGNGHVVVLVEQLPDGRWITAEGGGGLRPEDTRGMSHPQVHATNGTVCRLSGPKDIWSLDTLGRLPAGWWRSDLVVPTYDDILNTVKEQ